MTSGIKKDKPMHLNGVHYIHYLITIFFCIGFPMLPPLTPVSESGMYLLGALIGAVYGWSTIGNILPSILALFGVSLHFGITQMVSMSFGNMVTVFVMFSVPALGVLNSSGTMSFLVSKVMTSKAIVGKPWLTVSAILFSAMFLGMAQSLVVLLLYMAFLKTLLDSIGVERYSLLSTLLYLGLLLASCLGTAGIPFIGMAALVAAYAEMTGGATVDLLGYLLIVVPTSVCILAAYIACMKFIFKVDVSALANIKPEMFGDASKMTRDQGLVLFFFAIWLTIVVCSSVPALGPLFVFSSKFGMLGSTFLLVIAFMCVKKEDGTGPLMDFNEEVRMVTWDALLLTAVIMLLATACFDPATGLSAALSLVLQPLTGLPPMVFLVVVLAFAGFITNFANNKVCAVIIMPFIYNFCTTHGVDAFGYIMLLFLMVNVSIATPGACGASGIAYAQADIIDPKKMTRCAFMVLPILLVVAAGVGCLLATIV